LVLQLRTVSTRLEVSVCLVGIFFFFFFFFFQTTLFPAGEISNWRESGCVITQHRLMERSEEECSTSSSSSSSSSSSTNRNRRTCRTVHYRRFIYETHTIIDETRMGAFFDFGNWAKSSTPSLRADINNTVDCLVPRSTKNLATFNDLAVNLRFDENTRVAHLGAKIADLEKAESARQIATYFMAIGFALAALLVIVAILIYFQVGDMCSRSSSSYTPSSYKPYSSGTSFQSSQYNTYSGGSSVPITRAPVVSNPAVQPAAPLYPTLSQPAPYVVPSTWQPVGVVQPIAVQPVAVQPAAVQPVVASQEPVPAAVVPPASAPPS
jgi:hypothetical protein